MSVNLITGNLFSPIQASQDSDYQAGTFGEKTQILNVGSKMAVSIVDNSTIRCEDGVLVTKEGRRVQIDNGDVVEWTIPTGTQGTTSYYIVGFRLYTDNESAQLCDTFVQLVSGPGATITEDTFRDGAVEIFVSVARVVQNGITLKSVEGLVPVATTLNEIDDINDSIRTNLLNPTAQTQTFRGVTITNNGDGTYLVNGTFTGTSTNWIVLGQFTFKKNMKCKLIGTPPTSTLGEKGCLRLERSGSVPVLDIGNGAVFDAYSESNYALYLQIYPRAVFNNYLFKPMLTTDLNAKYSDYVPYTGDSGRLNEDVAEMNGAISQINSNLSDKSFSVTASNQSINLTSFDCKRFGSMGKLSIYGTTVRQLDANKAYFIPNLYIDGMQNVGLYGCGITRTVSGGSTDGADSFPCIVSVSDHSACFTPLVTIPNNYGMAIELLCYLL